MVKLFQHWPLGALLGDPECCRHSPRLCPCHYFSTSLLSVTVTCPKLVLDILVLVLESAISLWRLASICHSTVLETNMRATFLFLCAGEFLCSLKTYLHDFILWNLLRCFLIKKNVVLFGGYSNLRRMSYLFL